jgi:hypothetical protein
MYLLAVLGGTPLLALAAPAARLFFAGLQ